MKKNQRGMMGYVALVAAFILIAVALNGGLGQSVSRRIEYPELLTAIREDNVKAVAIRGTSLVGLYRNGTVADADFPERGYDFETTIGSDFIDTVRQMTATAQGKSLDEVSVSDLPFTVEYRAPVVTPWYMEFLPFILMIVITMAAWYFIMARQGGGNSKVMNFGKSRARMSDPSKNPITFKDVAGAKEEKEELQEMVDFLKNPKAYTDMGARIPKGVLLVGPPGTGKTLLAKAVAGEANAPFFSISGSDFVEMFVGVGASRVRDLFDQAKKAAPSIVFIDEIDAVGRHRGAGLGGGHDEREQTLNQLLTEMDGFDAGKGVVILAATNRPESLDKALLRPGRFDRRVPVELPDLQGREAILRVHARAVKMSKDVNFTAIARATSGASGAELANIINEGALAAVKAGRALVEQQDLEEAVETVIAGYQRKNAVISMKDKLTVSYHEVGHALVAAKLNHSAPVHKITIVPRTSGALGYTMQVDDQDQVLMTREQILDKITTFTGGRAAEELIFGSVTSGASNDIEQATKLARAMITRLGMSDSFDMTALETVNNPYLGGDAALMCSADTAAKVDVEVVSIIRNAHAQAKRILEDNKPKLHELAKYLLDKETITGDEFMEILNRVPELPPEGTQEEDE